MKTIDPAILAAYTGDGAFRVTAFQLIELIGSTQTYRYTDAPIPITWGGFTWSNIWFDVTEVTIDAEGEMSCTVSFEDSSRTIRTLAFAESMQDRSIKLYEVWADSANVLFGQDLVMQGITDGVRCEEEVEYPRAMIAVRSVFAASGVGIGPTQDYTRNCRYKEFKGPQCKYAGAATFCDRLYTTCQTYNNTINFGGFRFALAEGQKIEWGANDPQFTQARHVQAYEPPPPPAASPAPAPRRRSVGR